MNPATILAIIACCMFVVIIYDHKQKYEEKSILWLRIQIESLVPQIVSIKLHSGTQYDRTYNVTFTGQGGQLHTVRCKVDYARHIFWETHPSQLLNPKFDELVEQIHLTADTVRPALDSFTASERLAAVRELATHTQISHELRAQLAQMAVNDEDAQVREEAKAIVRRN
ncbi:MAG: hypothetical protein OT477_17605 [Chloroflexi bacterium]|nr:hypothetical protein [Chloroflexota bacterium]